MWHENSLLLVSKAPDTLFNLGISFLVFLDMLVSVFIDLLCDTSD